MSKDKENIHTKELKNLEIDDNRKEVLSPKRHLLVHNLLILLIIISIGYFIYTLINKESSIQTIINHLLISIFVILFSVVGITYKRNSKSLILITSIVLFGYYTFNFIESSNILHNNLLMPNFSGTSITEVMKWAKENKVVLNQEYEYSDMVSEYKIISQSLMAGEEISSDTELTVSISEGPSPYKEIMIPNMISWNSERVLEFVKDNYLSNVEVEFIESDKEKNTVIEQNTSGSLKRDDLLKLVFSYGEGENNEEISLIDFTNKSKFEVVFYMKENQLKYKFKEEFSDKIKRGYASNQSIKAGEKVKVNVTEIEVTISKGSEIKVPDFTKYSIEEVSEWAIKNKVKINFTSQYDESIEENHIISSNYHEGDIIEQGSIVKLVISKGNLRMVQFRSVDDFTEWANKYSIHYEEIREFNDSVPAGEIISYSHKEGDTIKNNDSIVVKISNGVKRVVPNLIGLSKNEAINKLNNAGLKGNFIYRNNSAAKDKVIAQSIRAGSDVSDGSTVTVTLSNGKQTSTVTPTPTPTPTPQPVCNEVHVYIYDELLDPQNPTNTCSKIKSRYPTLKFNCQYVQDSGLTNGILKNSASVDDTIKTTCDTILLQIVKN